MVTGESVQAKAVKDALLAFLGEIEKRYMESHLVPARIGINRPTWARLDHMAWYHWRRDFPPDYSAIHPGEDLGFTLAGGMVWVSPGSKYRILKIVNPLGGGWLELEEDVHLPDGMVELVYELGPAYRFQTAGHAVDITPLLIEQHTR